MEKNEYKQKRRAYNKMTPEQLEKVLGDFYIRRYFNYEIELDNEYRLVSSVYLEKTRTGDSLIFHLKNYVK